MTKMADQLRQNADGLLRPYNSIPHTAIVGSLRLAAAEIDRLEAECRAAHANASYSSSAAQAAEIERLTGWFKEIKRQYAMSQYTSWDFYGIVKAALEGRAYPAYSAPEPLAKPPDDSTRAG